MKGKMIMTNMYTLPTKEKNLQIKKYKVELVEKQFKELLSKLYSLNPNEFTSDDWIKLIEVKAVVLARITTRR